MVIIVPAVVIVFVDGVVVDVAAVEVIFWSI